MSDSYLEFSFIRLICISIWTTSGGSAAHKHWPCMPLLAIRRQFWYLFFKLLDYELVVKFSHSLVNSVLMFAGLSVTNKYAAIGLTIAHRETQ